MKNPIFLFCVSFNSTKEFLQQHEKTLPNLDYIISINDIYIFNNGIKYMEFRYSFKVLIVES